MADQTTTELNSDILLENFKSALMLTVFSIFGGTSWSDWRCI